MKEDILFRRRNRLKHHFVNTSNVLLYGYTALSDAAKITFQIIDGFDWEDAETADSKGYVFPSIATLAQIRHTSERTIYRHVKELEDAKLLTRVRRRNQASILYIEDISEKEADTYLSRYVDKTASAHVQAAESTKSRTDKNGSSHKASELTKMAVAYKEKKEEKKENEMNVNADGKTSEEKKRCGMQGVGDILKRFNGVERARMQKNNVSSTNPTTMQFPNQPKVPSNPKRRKTDENIQRDYFATQIAEELGDEKSLGCYRVVAEKVPQHIIFETIASVKEVAKEGKIHKSRGALFVDLIKSYCKKHRIELAFRTTQQQLALT